MTYTFLMGRDLLDSLEVIRFAAEELRREQWCWQNLREAQKLRWRPNVLGQPTSALLRDAAASRQGQ